jgi:hypothetical protein
MLLNQCHSNAGNEPWCRLRRMLLCSFGAAALQLQKERLPGMLGGVEPVRAGAAGGFRHFQ